VLFTATAFFHSPTKNAFFDTNEATPIYSSQTQQSDRNGHAGKQLIYCVFWSSVIIGSVQSQDVGALNKHRKTNLTGLRNGRKETTTPQTRQLCSPCGRRWMLVLQPSRLQEPWKSKCITVKVLRNESLILALAQVENIT
jgi:hypothetical protein